MLEEGVAMKKTVLVSLLLAGLLLAGCQSNQSTSQSTTKVTMSENYSTDSSDSKQKNSQSSEATSSSETAESSTSESEEEMVSPSGLWNDIKREKLRSLMDSWGATMGQSYVECSPNRNVDFYGLPLPGALFDGTRRLQLNGQFVEYSWADNDEIASSGYTIVAAFSDAATQDYLEKHFYLFTIHNGQGVALVTMQNQDIGNSALAFNETENQNLKNSFAEIVQGD